MAEQMYFQHFCFFCNFRLPAVKKNFHTNDDNSKKFTGNFTKLKKKL